MAAATKNRFLDDGFSDESDGADAGYDSEAAEVSKGGRAAAPSGRALKRRKLSESEDDSGEEVMNGVNDTNGNGEASGSEMEVPIDRDRPVQSKATTSPIPSPSTIAKPATSTTAAVNKKRRKGKEQTPGVVYLSSLPPYLKPSALRNMLTQRGFGPITRLFLAPASKAKAGSKKNSRQLYAEGWIEFESKKTARRCADALNAAPVGGKKGGFYHDDVWNMKYLKSMAWSELMAGIREERREEEGRRDDERRAIAREAKRFIEGVEEGKRLQGIQKKRRLKAVHDDDLSGVVEDGKRTWRQFEVKGGNGKEKNGGADDGMISEDVRQVLTKIF